jgi:acyl-coenzyme A thioesterase PaaI-like protein
MNLPISTLSDPEADAAIASLRAACHSACIGCRSRREGGLGLRFEPANGSGVIARFDSASSYQGYPDRLHGGIIATLLDAAMTHSLFARRVLGYTARMEIRYRRPAVLGVPVTVTASIAQSRPPWFRVRAEVLQHGLVCASAEAVFRGERWREAAAGDGEQI